MTSPNLRTIGPTGQDLPLALLYSSQLLLTEKVSSGDGAISPVVQTRSQAIRATLVTPILREIRGYYHGGLNE